MSTYLLYQLKSSQLTPSSWYSLSVLPFLYSLDSSNFFQELADGRVWTERRREGSKKQRGKNTPTPAWFQYCISRKTCNNVGYHSSAHVRCIFYILFFIILYPL